MDCTFAFPQRRWAAAGPSARPSVTPEIALVLETTTAADLAGVAAHKQVCALGKGPVVPPLWTAAMWRTGSLRADPGAGRRTIFPGRPSTILPAANDASASSGQRGRDGGHERRCAVSPHAVQRGLQEGFRRYSAALPGSLSGQSPRRRKHNGYAQDFTDHQRLPRPRRK